LAQGFVFAGGEKEKAGTAAPVAAKELKFAHTDPPASLREEAALFFAEKVKEYTGGRYSIKTFPAGVLGNDNKLLELSVLGGVDFVVTGSALYGKYVKDMSLSLAPFLFENFEQGWEFYDNSAIAKNWYKGLEGHGLKVLATWEAGFRCLTTKKPVSTPADVRGMKLRVPPNPIHLTIWETIGASPVSMGIGELYMAIQQGVVDGQENPIPTIYAQKFHEVAPNIAITNHVYGPITVSASMVTWKQLSAADQNSVVKAAAEAAKKSRSMVVDQENDMMKAMEKTGAKITYPDLSLWYRASIPAYEKFKKDHGAEAVDALLKETESIKSKFPAKK
jgi:tripartite ATP-independent transporter DctP family solute receptor